MARPPITRTLRAGDYIPEGADADLTSGLTDLVGALNKHVGPVSAALNGQLTLEENFRAQWHTTSVITTADDWTTVMQSDLQNAFVLFDHVGFPVKYRRLPNGDCELASHGLVTIPAGPPAARTPILQLPASYAPAYEIVLDSSNSAFVYQDLRVDVYGRVLTGGVASTAGNWLKVAGRWTPGDRFLTPLSPWPYDFAGKFPELGKPNGVFLAEAAEQSGQNRSPSLSPVDWQFTSKTAGGVITNRIRIANVPGLTPGKKYELTFLVLWS